MGYIYRLLENKPWLHIIGFGQLSIRMRTILFGTCRQANEMVSKPVIEKWLCVQFKRFPVVTNL